MVKEFRDRAYRLREGEVSQPFQTDFGWHILTVDKIRGQLIDVRHVLLVPEISSKELKDAKTKLELIRKEFRTEILILPMLPLSFQMTKILQLMGSFDQSYVW